jgi:hypothetical protein
MRVEREKRCLLEFHMTNTPGLFHMCGQAGYVIDAGRLEKISVIFGMIDQARKSMGWYEFMSNGKPVSKRELVAAKLPLPRLLPRTSLLTIRQRFGYQIPGGVDIPHTFNKKDTHLDGLAIDPKGLAKNASAR